MNRHIWHTNSNRITIGLQFIDFREAFSFMTEVASIAEELNHHPTWHNTYNIVILTLSTHDEGNILTTKDTQLASRIDTIIDKYNPKILE